MCKYIPFLPVLFFHLVTKSQNLRDKVWVQGGGVSFTTTFTGSGTVNNYLDTFYSPYFAHGNSNICDNSGNLILISDGYHIYNSQVNLIENGDTIVPKGICVKELGWSSYSQSSIFLPLPFNQYYLFTPTTSDSNLLADWNAFGQANFDLLLYHKIDMNANGGLGKVVEKGKVLLKDVKLNKTNMMACRHGDGINWWLFKQAKDTNMVYKFLVRKDSIYNYGVQGFPEPHFGKWDQSGQAMFSQQGDRYAACIRGGGEQTPVNPPPVTPGKIFVADFDRCNGELSHPRVYTTKPASLHDISDTTQMENYTQGLCFSPNGRFLYVSSYSNIKQLDLLDPDTNTQWSLIYGIDTVWDYFNTYSSMYLGPDNKLYIGHWNGLGDGMSVIEYPDLKGAACGFCPLCLRFPRIGVAPPPCMPNYHLGAAPVGGNCWPLASEEVTMEENDVKIYPNPAHQTLLITLPEINKQESMLSMYDVLGRERMRVTLPKGQQTYSVNISELEAGVYVYKIYDEQLIRSNGKVVIE